VPGDVGADPRPVRVLLAKPGLDGHDRGIKVVAMALRDAGAEVIYLGMRRSAEQIVTAAVAEDVDVIGLSILSGAHLALGQEVMEVLERAGARIPVVIGGTVPEADREALLALGVRAVFPVGTDLRDLVDAVMGGVAR
jgi:methylmalonyl-CoA mutase C-terminal domain/subunit